MELKDVFGEIESDGADLVHERLLEWALTPPLWHAEAVGGVHTITPGLPASGGARLSPPGRDCLIGEPDRQASTLAQAGVISRPVRDLMFLPRNMVAAGLFQLERQDGHPTSEGGAVLPHPALSTTPPADPCNTPAA